MAFKDVPVDVGVVYEGERVRRPQMYVELGGPKVKYKFELVRARGMDDVEDGKVEVIGPDLKEVEEGSRVPLGIYVEVAGEEVEEELEGVIERKIHEFCNYIEGFMHLNQRYDIWLRLSKSSFGKGLNSFHWIGKVLMRLYKSDLPIIEKIQVAFITDPEKVKEMYERTLEVYSERDKRTREMSDSDVDVFYGCTLCQSFAPSHVCVITPDRYANCGAISWLDGRAAAKVDPKGPIFEIEKGECLDEWRGEYAGANKVVKEKSLGVVERVQLYTAFGYPHTSCGCFEAIGFYIPEVDGLGVVHRDFGGKTINGLPFSTMADSTAGGTQIDGFHGLSIEYMRSPKFLQVDGGWNRIVWVPKDVKEKVKEFIPRDVVDKIPTEGDATTIDELRRFLEERNHPVVERWKKVEEAVIEEAAPAEALPQPEPPVEGAIAVPTTGGRFKITLENAKISCRRLVFRKRRSEHE